MKWQRSKPSTLAAAVAAAAAAELKARRDRARISKWSELESRIESYMEKADGKHHTLEITKSYMVNDAVKRPIAEKVPLRPTLPPCSVFTVCAPLPSAHSRETLYHLPLVLSLLYAPSLL